MENKTETLLNNHINRLEKNIKERDQSKFSDGTRKNPMDAMLDEADLNNIASLREGRIPQYSDHMDCLLGDDSMDMFEFSDLATA